jgi:antitoxin ParD1/3/4
MTISLTPELEKIVEARVQRGQYASPTEVIREALLLLEKRDNLRAMKIEELRDRIDHSLASLDRGEGIDGEPFMQELLDELDSQEAQRKAG